MRMIDMFSGIGGFHLAFKQMVPGTEVVGFSEIFDPSIEVYRKHFGEVPNYGDITKIETNDLPEFDMLCGGFPCQAFSIAGKRKGFTDERGSLFFEVARILDARRPRIIILENVKGLLNHEKGTTFRKILQKLDELGYDCEWQLFNSKNYGVPQNRQRVYLIGHLRGTPWRRVLPIAGSSTANLKEITQGLSDAQRIYEPTCAKTLKALGGGQGAKTGLYAMTEQRTEEAKEIRRAAMKEGRDFCPRRAKELVPRKDQIMNCLTTKVTKEHYLTDKKSIVRTLTPIEAERLQGFPDNWTAGHSNSQRIKMCGNAVTVNVVAAIAKRLKEVGNI
jgi:DNA (cytosine-5)-methyltransferase 1